MEGTVSDEHLESVKVNGQDAKITDGKFSLRILLNEGENIITVAAQDKAGNKTEKTVTIHAVYTAPAIENLLPTDDKELKKGESVKIEFDSAPGLKTIPVKTFGSTRLLLSDFLLISDIILWKVCCFWRLERGMSFNS